MMKAMHFLLFLLLMLPLSVSAEKILIFRQGSQNFEEVVKAVKMEIGDELEIVDQVLSKEAKYKVFHDKVRAEKPDLLLLLDNKAVNFAKKFNKEKDDYAKNLKGVAAMGLNLRKELKGNKNICAVEYEVPAYTLITSYRYIVEQKIENVLVFYRGSEHKEIIEDAKEQLKKEKINLKAMDAEEYGTSDEDVNFFLQRNMLREIYRKDIDLVWVISDSVMLNNDNFANLWVSAAKRNKVPFISGIKSFSLKEMQFCAYSASPNHQDLGAQIAEMLFTVIDGEEPEALGVEYILSVVKTANMDKLNDNDVSVKQDKMSDVKVTEK